MKTISYFSIPVFILFIISGCVREKSFIYEISLSPLEGSAVMASSDYDTGAAVIRKRLINFGIHSDNIKTVIIDSGLTVTFSGADTSDYKTIEKIVTEKGWFGLWETYENREVIPYLSTANTMLKSVDLSGILAEISTVDTMAPDVGDDMLLADQDTASLRANEEFRKANPLFSVLRPMVNQEGEPMPSSVIGMAAVTDTSAVMKMLEIFGEQNIFPRDLFFCWSSDPYRYDPSNLFFELHAVKLSTYSGMPLLDASVIAVAKPVKNKRSSDVYLSVFMNSEGANLWRRMTRENIDRCIAIIIDGQVLVSPRVATEIENGKSDITGDFTLSELKALSCILTDFGKPLPFPMKIAGVRITREE
jgi:SecD/SecF fusion protein